MQSTRGARCHFDNAGQALYMEQEIERFLGIKDVPVRGEMVR